MAHTSAHLNAESLWTDPDTKSGINVRELISTLKKKAQAENEWSNIEHSPKILASEEKNKQTNKQTPPQCMHA